jgi:transposase-like protein
MNGDIMNTIRKKRQILSADEKEQVIESWKRSGQSMKDYCKTHPISISSLSKWSRKLRLPQVKLNPIKIDRVSSMSSTVPLLVVNIRNNIKLYFNSLEDVSSVSQLIKELES